MDDMREMERLCSADIIWTQRFISLPNRQYTIEWMGRVLVAADSAILFLAVELLDQYLGRYQVARDRLQHLAIACINLAWKAVEDELPPTLSQWSERSKGHCTPGQLFDMEVAVATGLGFKLEYPTVINFLRCTAGVPDETAAVARRILELSLLAPCGPQFRPSQRAAVAISIAQNLIRGFGPDDGTIAPELAPCRRWLTAIMRSQGSPRWLDKIYETALLAGPSRAPRQKENVED
jgi:hypothetical protein